MSEPARPSHAPALPGLGLMVALAAAGLITVVAARAGRTAVPGAGAAPASARALPDMRVDVNRASPGELALLPGIGPAMAERIAADRARRGRFESVDDLQRVDGIGPATVERLRPYAVVD